MSPFLVYLLMIADDIKGVFSFIAVLLGIIVVISFVGRAIACCAVYQSDINDKTRDWRIWQTWVAYSRWTPWFFALSLAVSTFVPNTRTIAAMIVLPQLTSPQALNAMSSEAQELYGLAKQALHNLVEPEKPKDQRKHDNDE